MTLRLAAPRNNLESMTSLFFSLGLSYPGARTGLRRPRRVLTSLEVAASSDRKPLEAEGDRLEEQAQSLHFSGTSVRHRSSLAKIVVDNTMRRRRGGKEPSGGTAYRHSDGRGGAAPANRLRECYLLERNR